MNRSISAQSLEDFIFYMSFFEHSHKLKEEGIVSRKLVAPDLEDSSSIKKRLAQVLLRSLRSEALYDFPQKYSKQGYEATLVAISRWRKQESELERYMRFILEIEVVKPAQNLFPSDPETGLPLFSILTEESDRAYFFDNCVQPSSTQSDVRRDEILNFFMTNYDILIVPRSYGGENSPNSPHPSLEALFSSPISTLANDSLLDYRIVPSDSRLNPVQTGILSNGSFYRSASGRMDMRNLVLAKAYDYIRHSSIPDGWKNTEGRGCGSYIVPEHVYMHSGFIDKMGDDNIFIPCVTGESPNSASSRGQNMSSGYIVLARRDEDSQIVPNLVRSVVRFTISYNRDSLLNPDRFFVATQHIASRFRSVDQIEAQE